MKLVCIDHRGPRYKQEQDNSGDAPDVEKLTPVLLPLINEVRHDRDSENHRERCDDAVVNERDVRVPLPNNKDPDQRYGSSDMRADPDDVAERWLRYDPLLIHGAMIVGRIAAKAQG